MTTAEQRGDSGAVEAASADPATTTSDAITAGSTPTPPPPDYSADPHPTADSAAADKSKLATADPEVVVVSSDDAKPEAPKEKEICPEASASWISKITFHWMNSIFLKGWRHPLTDDDMWIIGPKMQAKYLVEQFERNWNEELKKKKTVAPTQDDSAETSDGKKKKKGKKPVDDGPSLLNALKMTYWNSVAPLGILKLISDMCTVFSPLFVKYIIINVATPNSTMGEGFGLIIGLFALQILSTFFLNNFFQYATVAGMNMRATFSATIYRKSMRLSAASRQNFNSGKVINLVATDANRIEQFMTFIHIIWTAPIQILVIIGFLISQLGWAAIVGVSLLVILTPVQGLLWKKLASIRGVLAPITDSRVKLTTEVLTGIRVLKMFAWEQPFLEMIEEIRKKEIAQVLKRSVLNAFVQTIAFGIPIISGAIAFVLFGLTNPLEASKVFSALTWFNQLRFPLMFLPGVIAGWADFKVAVTRIQEMLLAPELDEQPEIVPDAYYAVQIVQGEFKWEAPPPGAAPAASGAKSPGGHGHGHGGAKRETRKEKKKRVEDEAIKKKEEEEERRRREESAGPPKSALRNINLTVERGSLVAVVGSVGAGKSSLLNAIIGEMKRVSGTVSFSGSLGYAPQTAWIQNATLENNIIFGRAKDRNRYLRAIRDCALEQDLRILPDGDQTSIGERGINLSGGQKQRVNLARCVYYDPDIVLLDDPLSAVDAHVGRFLFDECICGALASKTRILVTHQLHFLSRVDKVVVMRDGEIVEQGSYAELLKEGGEFATLMNNYGAEESSESKKESAENRAETLKDEKLKLDKLGGAVAKNGAAGAKEIMKEEDRATGTVSGKVWWSYAVAAGGFSFIFGLFATLIMIQAAQVGGNLWLVWWSENLFGLTLAQYIGIYCGWGIFQAFATCLFGIFFAYAGTRAARVLHESAAARIVRAPASFFDTTPLGRIINRFSKDQDGIDNTLADAYRMFANTLATSISTFVLICYATPLFLAPLIPILVVYYFMQLIYRSTSRELKRLDSVSRSPLYANFGETLVGLPTIRAYRDQQRFINNNDAATDGNNSPYFLLIVAQRWLGLRLEILGALLVFFAAVFGLVAKNSISPGLLGLSLSYALQVTMILNWCIRQFTDTEIAMNAVERVHAYGYEIETEAPAVIESNRPAESWPEKGTIEFKSVEMSYAPDLPLVLKAVSFTINDREKVGVVGRTGSGKSSLMQALFRMVEVRSGNVLVGGIDAGTIGLRDLRSKLAIIPQDPVLFTGTYRSNLDPFSLYKDADLWDSLARAGLKSKVVETEGGLDGKVVDGGENLSVGQRQLLCLARAMLKKPRILIMDEATANVDYETDALIQKALRDDFADATVLTIAHRLNTIMDYSRVMVLDAGKIIEFDTPASLLDDETSRFRSMVAETGAANFEMLRAIARGEGPSTGVVDALLSVEKDVDGPSQE